jgi:hypothetical protein
MKINSTFPLLLFIFLFINCNQKKETKKETGSTTKPKESEQRIIQPQTERDSLKGSLQAIATGKIGNSEVIIRQPCVAASFGVDWFRSTKCG